MIIPKPPSQGHQMNKLNCEAATDYWFLTQYLEERKRPNSDSLAKGSFLQIRIVFEKRNGKRVPSVMPRKKRFIAPNFTEYSKPLQRKDCASFYGHIAGKDCHIEQEHLCDCLSLFHPPFSSLFYEDVPPTLSRRRPPCGRFHPRLGSQPLLF